MKNLMKVLALLMLVAFTTPTFAQTKPKKEEAKKEEVKLKKDGTPDKRFKENKKAEVKLKKDGTPDKRFKANK
jgi:hypothetical protein